MNLIEKNKLEIKKEVTEREQLIIDGYLSKTINLDSFDNRKYRKISDIHYAVSSLYQDMNTSVLTESVIFFTNGKVVVETVEESILGKGSNSDYNFSNIMARQDIFMKSRKGNTLEQKSQFSSGNKVVYGGKTHMEMGETACQTISYSLDEREGFSLYSNISNLKSTPLYVKSL